MTTLEPPPTMSWENAIVPASPATGPLVPVTPTHGTTTLQPYVPSQLAYGHPMHAPMHHYAPPPVVPAPAAANETIISVADIISYFGTYWKRGIAAAIPLAAAAFYMLGFGPKVYEAEAMLQVSIQDNMLLKLDKLQGSGPSELSAVQIINNHRTGLKTRRYIEYLFQHFPVEDRDAFLAGTGELGLRSRVLIAIGLKDPPRALPPEELFANKLDKTVRIEPVKESYVLRDRKSVV